MKKIIAILTLSFAFTFAKAQVYYSKNASVGFFSKTNMEDIKADNNQVLTVLNAKTGEMQFSLAVKGFHFAKPLMEEHFNENYMESSKYPKSTFKGTIANFNKVDLKKSGTYKVVVNGDLTMHGVTNKVSAPGTIVVKDGKVSSSSKFTVALADYKVIIPKLVQQTIQKTIDITVACKYDLK